MKGRTFSRPRVRPSFQPPRVMWSRLVKTISVVIRSRSSVTVVESITTPTSMLMHRIWKLATTSREKQSSVTWEQQEMPTARQHTFTLGFTQATEPSILCRSSPIDLRKRRRSIRSLRRQVGRRSGEHRARLALKPSRPRQQLPQHIRQDAAVQVVVDLDGCVDA